MYEGPESYCRSRHFCTCKYLWIGILINFAALNLCESLTPDNLRMSVRKHTSKVDKLLNIVHLTQDKLTIADDNDIADVILNQQKALMIHPTCIIN